ncbi:hypothetical protein F5X97DRAFT_310374, partial [Nemania serpens]
MNDTLSASRPLGKCLLNEDSSKDIGRDEALRWTIRTHQLDLLRQLIADGADVNAEAEYRDRPIHLAANIGACEEILVLHEAGAAIDIV